MDDSQVKPTKSQQLMIEDGMPAKLLLTQEQRAAAWEKNPPKAMLLSEIARKPDPESLRMAEENAIKKKEKARARIELMIAKKEGKTKVMPLQGKVALELIRNQETTMSDDQVDKTKSVKLDVKASQSTNPSKETKVAQKAKAKTTAKKTKTNGSNGARVGSKTEIIAKLLKRKNGCTNADILAATGWPTVSVPAMAKAAQLELRKEKEKGSPTRYYGT